MILTGDHDIWGFPIEERKEAPKPRVDLIDKKKVVHEANDFLESIDRYVGGWLMEATPDRARIEKVNSSPSTIEYQVVVQGDFHDIVGAVKEKHKDNPEQVASDLEKAFTSKEFSEKLQKEIAKSLRPQGISGVEVLVVSAPEKEEDFENGKLEMQIKLHFDAKDINSDILEKDILSLIKDMGI